MQPDVFFDFASLPDTSRKIDVCNCYTYLRDVYEPHLPPEVTILNNLKTTGTVAVFFYVKSGLYHYAHIEKVTPSGYLIDEANFKKCHHQLRFVAKNDPNLLGFFTP